MNCEEKIKVFKKLADADKLSHAYLFFGEENPRFLENGKVDFALSLANYLEKGKFEKPEQREILEEVLIISAAESGAIGIDETRNLPHFLHQTPVFSKKRTVIINGAQNLTNEAQNSILKIIEDSPQFALIILIATNEDLLLPALASRLQKFYFSNSVKISQLKPLALKMTIEEIIENNKIDDYFENLILELRKDAVKNVDKLRETLKRLTFIKIFSTNKKLQLRCLLQL